MLSLCYWIMQLWGVKCLQQVEMISVPYFSVSEGVFVCRGVLFETANHLLVSNHGQTAFQRKVSHQSVPVEPDGDHTGICD